MSSNRSESVADVPQADPRGQAAARGAQAWGDHPMITDHEASTLRLPEPASYRLASGGRIHDMHADDVDECVAVYETYASTLSAEDAMAHALAAWRACRERRVISERAAARRRDYNRGIRAGE